MTTQEKISALQAFLEGKLIQFKDRREDRWFDCGTTPVWNFEDNDYRVRPESRTVELTMSDIKPGTWLKNTLVPESNVLVLATYPTGVHLWNCARNWEELRKYWLRSTDLVNWTPCEKEV